MEAQKNNSSWWKWILGIATAGGAWYLLSGFKASDNILELPPPPEEGITEDINFQINIWRNRIMSNGNPNTWADGIMEVAIAEYGSANKRNFEKALQGAADSMFVEQGLMIDHDKDFYESTWREIDKVLLAINRNASHLELLVESAQQRGISLEKMKVISAIWSIVNKKVDKYVASKSTTGSSTYNATGYAGISLT